MSLRACAWAVCLTIFVLAAAGGYGAGWVLGAGVWWGVFVGVVLALWLVCMVIWWVFVRDGGPRLTG